MPVPRGQSGSAFLYTERAYFFEGTTTITIEQPDLLDETTFAKVYPVKLVRKHGGEPFQPAIPAPLPDDANAIPEEEPTK